MRLAMIGLDEMGSNVAHRLFDRDNQFWCHSLNLNGTRLQAY